MKINSQLLKQLIKEELELALNEGGPFISQSPIGLPLQLGRAVWRDLNRTGLPSIEVLDALSERSPEELAGLGLTHEDINNLRDFQYSRLIFAPNDPASLAIDTAGATMAAADGPLLFGDTAAGVTMAGSRLSKLRDIMDVAGTVRDTAAVWQAPPDTSDTGD